MALGVCQPVPACLLPTPAWAAQAPWCFVGGNSSQVTCPLCFVGPETQFSKQLWKPQAAPPSAPQSHVLCYKPARGPHRFYMSHQSRIKLHVSSTLSSEQKAWDFLCQ